MTLSLRRHLTFPPVYAIIFYFLCLVWAFVFKGFNRYIVFGIYFLTASTTQLLFYRINTCSYAVIYSVLGCLSFSSSWPSFYILSGDVLAAFCGAQICYIINTHLGRNKPNISLLPNQVSSSSPTISATNKPVPAQPQSPAEKKVMSIKHYSLSLCVSLCLSLSVCMPPP